MNVLKMDQNNDSPHQYIIFKKKKITVKLDKSQTEPFTEKIVEQLIKEPKVVVQRLKRNQESAQCYPSLDRNVPDLSDIGNYVECSSNEEDIYVNTNIPLGEKSNGSWVTCDNERLMTNNNGRVNTQDIEIELTKMFENGNEVLPSQDKSDKVKKSISRKNRKSKHPNVKELIIELFGSPLDDIEVPSSKPVKIQANRRRHTLPVSINIPNDDFLPLKVNHKRKSDADVHVNSSPKVQKAPKVPVVAVSEVVNVEYTSASNLVVPTIYSETANVRSISKELYAKATVGDQPCFGQCEIVKTKDTVPAFIDLTKDDNFEQLPSVIHFEGIRIEIKSDVTVEDGKASKSSERANVPERTLASMPLLSPVSPTEPTQAEAVLPQGTVQATVMPQIRPEVMQLASSQRPPPKVQKQQSVDRTKRKEQGAEQKSQRMNVVQSSGVKPQVQRIEKTQGNWKQGLKQSGGSVQIRVEPESCVQQKVQAVPAQNQQMRQTVHEESLRQQLQQMRHRQQQENYLQQQNHQAAPLLQQNQQTQQTQQVSQQQNIPQAPPVFQQAQPKRQMQQQESSQQQKAQKIKHSILEELSRWESQRQQTQIPAQTVPNQGNPAYENHNQGIGNFQTPVQGRANFPNLKAALVSNQQMQANQPQPQVASAAMQSLAMQQQWLRQSQQMVPQQDQRQPQQPLVTQNPQTTILNPQVTRIPAPPQLVRLVRAPTVNIVSNNICAERIFPHVERFQEWRTSFNTYFKATKCMFLTGDVKDDIYGFGKHLHLITRTMGKSLIKDLATVNVPDFAMEFVLEIVSDKMMEKKQESGIFRMCAMIHNMIKSCEDQCTTPFTKKFFSIVMACMVRIEARWKEPEVPKFSFEQLQRLEMQIQQYLLIQHWLNMQSVAACAKQGGQGQANRRPKSPPPYAQRPSQVPMAPLNALMQATQAMLDRSATTTYAQKGVDRPHDASLNRRTVGDRSPRSVPEIVPAQTNAYQASVANVVPTGQIPAVPSETTSVCRPNVTQTSDISAHPTDHCTSSAQPNECSLSASPQTLPSKESQVASNQARVESVIAVAPPSEESGTVKHEAKGYIVDGEVIDLTWIDDGDENEIMEEIIECKAFPFKVEESCEGNDEEGTRKVVSPVDSGLGSPVAQLPSDNDGLKCLCGNRAIYVCACQSSMYCSEDCQVKDWTYHQKLCHKMQS